MSKQEPQTTGIVKRSFITHGLKDSQSKRASDDRNTMNLNSMETAVVVCDSVI
jgi:hypothetical protein